MNDDCTLLDMILDSALIFFLAALFPLVVIVSAVESAAARFQNWRRA
jgi:hypothetical protein